MENDINEKLNLLEIHRMAIHNGPGIRTTVHFKGCPLRCAWCSTPESQRSTVQLASRPDKCLGCGACASVCKAGAIGFDDTGRAFVKRELCKECMKCTQVCCTDALAPLGRSITADELYKEIVKDKILYSKSNGGVTFSGGEPLMSVNDEYVKLLKMLKEEDISIGFDTCGYVPPENLEKVMPYTDFFLWDLKHMDSKIHKEITGADNMLILDNLRYAAESKKIYIRYPFITGYTDDDRNRELMAEFLLTLKPVPELHIMPMHHMGAARYEYLGEEERIGDIPLQEKADLEAVRLYFERSGIVTKIVG